MSDIIQRSIKDVVDRLKAQGAKNYGLYAEAVSTIEALRGEVDLIKTLGVGAALETVAQKERAQKAEAARLKGALEEAVKWMEGCAVGGGYPAWYVKARKALAGETT